jgi:hypothetical protein
MGMIAISKPSTPAASVNGEEFSSAVMESPGLPSMDIDMVHIYIIRATWARTDDIVSSARLSWLLQQPQYGDTLHLLQQASYAPTNANVGSTHRHDTMADPHLQ